MDPIRKLRIRINQDEARQLGLSSAAVAQMINAAVSGITSTQVRDSIYLIDVVVRAQADERMSLETIRTLKIPLPNGRSVPLSELARVEYEQDLPLIWRRDRLPTLTVQAEPRDGVLPATAVAGLAEKVSELKRQLPVGYKIVEGGSVEESAKGQASVLAVFPIVVVLMITVLMFQMQSFSRLFLVCSVAPLGVIGVVLALLVTQSPMGFVAMLGTVALIGMIVRNSVIMVDQIEVEKAAGRGGWDAVVEASLVRFRPITLTAQAMILGMAPPLKEDSHAQHCALGAEAEARDRLPPPSTLRHGRPLSTTLCDACHASFSSSTRGKRSRPWRSVKTAAVGDHQLRLRRQERNAVHDCPPSTGVRSLPAGRGDGQDCDVFLSESR